MIYFVDEHHRLFDPGLERLRGAGYGVEALWNANEAYRLLHAMGQPDIDLVIIDVMLAVDYALDIEDEQFSSARTHGFLMTGLCLLEDLAIANPGVFPRHAVLLTNAFEKRTLTAARESSSRFGIQLWAKSEFDGDDGTEFACRVIEYIDSLGHRSQNGHDPTA